MKCLINVCFVFIFDVNLSVNNAVAYSSKSHHKRMVISSWNLGIMFLIWVTFIWTFASLLTQFIYEDLDFTSPFILTYISSSFFSLYLPLWKIWCWLGYAKDPPKFRRRVTTQNSETSYTSIDRDITVDISFNRDIVVTKTTDSSNNIDPIVDPIESQRRSIPSSSVPSSCIGSLKQNLIEWMKPLDSTYTHEDVVYVCLVFFPLWFLANILYNYSLLLTSISSSTIIRYVCLVVYRLS